MRNILILFSLCLTLISQTYAKEASKAFSLSEIYSGEIESFLNSINDVSEYSDINLNGLKVSNSCNQFMNSGHILGNLGQAIKSEIQSHTDKYKRILGSSQLPLFCKNYQKMNASEKSLLWTLILTAMAYFESSCDVSQSTRGPNGTAKGLYQLHLGKESSYSSLKSACTTNVSRSAFGSSKCALEMLTDQMRKSGGMLFYSNSYWDVLRPNGPASKISKAPQRIRKAIQNHRSCM